jgi:putative two-component system response regulator
VQRIKDKVDDIITTLPGKKLEAIKTENSPAIDSILSTLIGVVENIDSYTQGHTERVACLAVALGEKMGLGENKLNALRFGGALHDVGKIGIDSSILNKPGPLDDEEWKVMKNHTRFGYRICLPLQKVLGPALDVIRHHHEKLDGSSYPDGLSGEQVSNTARILAVVDIYDAVITDRPYRDSLPKDKAIDILLTEAEEGKLDKEIVQNFITMIRSQVITG